MSDFDAAATLELVLMTRRLVHIFCHLEHIKLHALHALAFPASAEKASARLIPFADKHVGVQVKPHVRAIPHIACHTSALLL